MRTAFALFGLIFLFACTIEQPQVVTKPRHTLEFVEELRFGSPNEEDHYLWVGSSTTVSVDDQGYIFVADQAGNRVLQYDAEGTYVATIAREGQGPGELQALQSFDIIEDGAVAIDVPIGGVPSLVFFDKTYQYVTSIQPSQDNLVTPANLRFSPNGQFAAGSFIDFDIEANQMLTVSGLIDRSFKVIKTFHVQKQAIPSPEVYNDTAKLQEFLAASMSAFFKDIGFFGLASDGSLYQAISSTYEISKFNADLSRTGQPVTRAYEPIPNSEPHLNAMANLIFDGLRGTPGMEDLLSPSGARKIIEMAEPPPAKGPVFGLIAMEDGGFLVVHDINLDSGLQTADIFDAQGGYLGQVTREHAPFVSPSSHLFPRMTFRNGRAYTVESDEDGNNWVVRYRYQLVPTS